MSKKQYLIFGTIVILIGAISFISGMTYAKKITQSAPDTSGLNQANSRYITRTGGNAQGMNGGGRQGGQFGKSVNGEIISNDGTILTIKLRDGGSKLVFVTGTTKFDKSVSASMTDVSIGKTVMASGETNPDGSMTADIIQIRKDEVVQK